MNESCLRQIRYWSAALKQANKAIRRRNKHINRLEQENCRLRQQVASLHFELAEYQALTDEVARLREAMGEAADSMDAAGINYHSLKLWNLSAPLREQAAKIRQLLNSKGPAGKPEADPS